MHIIDSTKIATIQSNSIFTVPLIENHKISFFKNEKFTQTLNNKPNNKKSKLCWEIRNMVACQLYSTAQYMTVVK